MGGTTTGTCSPTCATSDASVLTVTLAGTNCASFTITTTDKMVANAAAGSQAMGIVTSTVTVSVNGAYTTVDAPCDATVATYTNGAAGTCTSATIASGTTCQTTCNAGYLVAGTSSCSSGTLTVAACNANVC